jgi:hypothetical protein
MPESRVEKNFWENNKEVIYCIIFFIVSMAIVLGILLSQGKHYSPSPWTTIETPTPTAIIETPTPTAIISKNMPVIGSRS